MSFLLKNVHIRKCTKVSHYGSHRRKEISVSKTIKTQFQTKITQKAVFRCEHCNKRFIKAHQLKCHLVTHGIGTPAKRKSRQTSSKNLVLRDYEAEEAAAAPTNISTDIQTVEVIPTSDDPTQTYMLYLKK